MVNWFGPASWNAPICRDTPRCDVPIGEQCGLCGRYLTNEDHGITMPYMGAEEQSVIAFHIDCFMKSILPNHAYRRS